MLNKLLGFSLMPLIYLQGIKVRKTVPELPEPQGLREGINGAGTQLNLLIIGDSAAAGVGVNHQRNALLGNLINNLQQRHRVNWQLHASTGATTADTIKAIDDLKSQKIDVIVTSLGVNDVTSGISAKTWLNNQLQLRQKLLRKFNPRLLLLSSLPPMGKIQVLPQPLRWFVGTRAEEFDQLLKQSCKGVCQYLQINVGKVDDMLAIDGFHPSARLYQIWGQQAAKLIQEQVY